jgi:hypothetical protein
MPVDFLSDEQVARYGRFAAEPSPGELEMFFRLDERAPPNRLDGRCSGASPSMGAEMGDERNSGAASNQ